MGFPVPCTATTTGSPYLTTGQPATDDSTGHTSADKTTKVNKARIYPQLSLPVSLGGLSPYVQHPPSPEEPGSRNFQLAWHGYSQSLCFTDTMSLLPCRKLSTISTELDQAHLEKVLMGTLRRRLRLPQSLRLFLLNCAAMLPSKLRLVLLSSPDEELVPFTSKPTCELTGTVLRSTNSSQGTALGTTANITQKPISGRRADFPLCRHRLASIIIMHRRWTPTPRP